MNLHCELKKISISEIDTMDRMCHLGLAVDAEGLIESVRLVGLINPPVLRRRDDGKYQVVCGFRRVAACSALGWRDIKSQVIADQVLDSVLLKLAILDNRSHRRLDAVEKANGIKKLSPHMEPADRLQALSSLLGFPENPKVLEKLEALSSLPRAIQAGVAEEAISLEAAVLLSRWPDDAGLCCFELLGPLKLSRSKQTEVINLIQEIAAREDLQPGDLIRSGAVKGVLDHADLNRNQKGSALRRYLKKRRFPALVEAEEWFSEGAKALKLTGQIHIAPPPQFEGGPYTLRVTFRNLKDFHERFNILRAAAESPALGKLLKPFG